MPEELPIQRVSSESRNEVGTYFSSDALQYIHFSRILASPSFDIEHLFVDIGCRRPHMVVSNGVKGQHRIRTRRADPQSGIECRAHNATVPFPSLAFCTDQIPSPEPRIAYEPNIEKPRKMSHMKAADIWVGFPKSVLRDPKDTCRITSRLDVNTMGAPASHGVMANVSDLNRLYTI